MPLRVPRSAPLLAPRSPLVVAAVAVATAVVVVLAVRYRGTVTPGAVDRTLDGAAHATLHNPVWNEIDVYFQQLADPTHAVVLVAVVAALALLVAGSLGAVFAVVGPGIAVVVTEVVIAPLVGRRHGADLSYPSGHVTLVAGVAVVVVVLALGDGRRTPGRYAVGALAVVVAAACTLAVVAEQTHYATDAAGAWAVALAVVLGVAVGLDALLRRLRRGPAAPPSGPATPGRAGPGR